MAVMQGPKGFAQYVVLRAVSESPDGKELTEQVAKYNYDLGNKLANAIENRTLDTEYDPDRRLIGGGELISAVLTGGLPGRKGGGERRSVSVDGGKRGRRLE